MDEWVDILDAEGRYTGEKILKSEAHQNGLFHPTVHIWFFTSEREILLQQRAGNKKTFPLYWDASVAGHIAAGEVVLKGAVREVEEEIGLKIKANALQPVGVFKSIQQHHSGLLDCEFHHTFICLLTEPVHALQKQKEEVEALKLMPLSIWEKDLFSNSPSLSYVPHQEAYYREVINAIRKRS
ncbi:NUDIX hydrolase [Muriicola soli]|uniref:NUDIX domain-containing protein n=1 Tax=Muriicola soli TaxID=2507538 RepID=A0A411E9L3_9FLAO|nr:NUDIX domain-containing protein [Muriicola soli]QBA64406.1 NUDIX domain-containing protein [Muriicola soli]